MAAAAEPSHPRPRAPKTLGVQFWTGELDGGHSAPICTSLFRERGGDTLGSGQVEVLVLAGSATTSKKNDNMS